MSRKPHGHCPSARKKPTLPPSHQRCRNAERIVPRDSGAQSGEACGTDKAVRAAAGVPDRHGGMRERALLGPAADGARTPGEIDGAAVCKAVWENEQER